jgi:hypothetical protein
MHYMPHNLLSDFLQVLYSARKLSAKNYYFSNHILFSIIYLLREQRFIHNNNSMQETNMSNFVQATEDDIHMYAKIQDLIIYKFL